ncbi:hypothetical protein AOLI_G00141590 [Acnodon oligacanthus]
MLKRNSCCAELPSTYSLITLPLTPLSSSPSQVIKSRLLQDGVDRSSKLQHLHYAVGLQLDMEVPRRKTFLAQSKVSSLGVKRPDNSIASSQTSSWRRVPAFLICFSFHLASGCSSGQASLTEKTFITVGPPQTQKKRRWQ